MANDNKHTALMGLENSIKNSGDLENNRYKNEAALRSPHEDDAALFDDIGNSVSAPGQRPRGLGANLAAGLSKGLAHGARTKATAEKKSKYEKHANVVNYLQQAQGEALKQNQWYEQEERRMETVKPFAVGGLEVAYSGMDYATGNERMRNIIEQAKIADPRIKGDYIGYVPNSPIVNLRTQDGEIIAYSLSNLVGEETVKRVQHNYIEEQKLADNRAEAPLKYGTMQDKLAQTKRRNDFMGLKNDLKLVDTFGKKVDSAKEFLTIVPHIKDILKNHSDIFQSAGQVIWQNDKEPGYMENFLKNVHSTMSPKKADALSKMVKYVNKMTLDVANGFSRPNMFIEKIGGKAVPNLNMTAKGFSEILDEMELEYKESMMNNLERMERLESDVGTGITDQYKDTTNKVRGGQAESPLAAFGKRIN